MNSRQRIQTVLDHEISDRIPLDLGGCAVTGMHVSSVYKLRQALKLDEPGTPVRVIDPYQMLGEIKPDLMEALGVDVVNLSRQKNMFGFKNEGWKPWETFAGTPVLVPEKFNTEPAEDGALYMYPRGDKSVPPSAKMPAGGYYFDNLSRQREIDDENLNVEDNLEEFNLISDEELEYLKEKADYLYNETDKAILAEFGGTSFGGVAQVPGPSLKNPRGIRDVEEWYISTISRRDYIYNVFAKQCEIALENLERIYEVVGNKVSICFISGTDFGMQQGPLISPQQYRDLFKPFHTKVNNWIHNNTEWKTFIHTDGSIQDFLDDIVEAGFDILNPIQISAVRMDPRKLKEKYGSELVFWGGGVNTQRTLPFEGPEEVEKEVRERMKILGQDGGFVFNSVHNIQARTPEENILKMYETYKSNAEY